MADMRARKSGLSIEVDADGQFARALNDLEKRQIPFATRQAINATAVDVRKEWAELMPKVFDRPTPLTTKAVLYEKATKARPFADIYIRDEAFKGTPPAKYLGAQVQGGQRRQKGLERQLSAAQILPAGHFVVPGRGAKLDQYGNLPLSQINQIKSQLKAHGDNRTNESDASRARRLKRYAKQGRRDGNYFAQRTTKNGKRAGIYERVIAGTSARAALGLRSSIRSVLIFVRRVTYTKRYPIFEEANRIYDRRFPLNFKIEFDKAVESATRMGPKK